MLEDRIIGEQALGQLCGRGQLHGVHEILRFGIRQDTHAIAHSTEIFIRPNNLRGRVIDDRRFAFGGDTDGALQGEESAEAIQRFDIERVPVGMTEHAGVGGVGGALGDAIVEAVHAGRAEGVPLAK